MTCLFSCYEEEDRYPYHEDKAWVETKAPKTNIGISARVIGENGEVLSDVRKSFGKGLVEYGDKPHPNFGLTAFGGETQGDCIDIYFSKDGYFSGYQTLAVKPNSKNFTTLILKELDQRALVDMGEMNEFSLDNGLKLTPKQGVSFHHVENRKPQFYINHVGPDSQNYIEEKIGGDLGIDEDFDPVGLRSFGMVHISGGTGTRINSGNLTTEDPTVDLEFPIPSGISVRPSEVPIWLFDRKEGVWLEKGIATLKGDKYVAEIIWRFGPWNLADIIENPVSLTVKVLVDGQSAPNHLIRIKYHDGFKTGAYTNTEGEMYLKNFKGDKMGSAEMKP